MYKICSILYKELEHPWVLAFVGGPGINPLQVPGKNIYLNSLNKAYCLADLKNIVVERKNDGLTTL